VKPSGSSQSGTGIFLWLAAIGAAALICFLTIVSGHAQSVQAAVGGSQSFEVASIKRSRTHENTSFHVLPNRLTVTNQTLDFYIKFAYGLDLGKFGFRNLRDNQLEGGPSWIYGTLSSFEGYDVDAKVEDALAERFAKLPCISFFSGPCMYRTQMLQMVQSLLGERFKLKVRRETKELRVYALIVAKGRPKFLHTTFDTADDPAHTADPTLPRPQRPPCPAGMSCWHNYVSMRQVAEVLSTVPVQYWIKPGSGAASISTCGMRGSGR